MNEGSATPQLMRRMNERTVLEAIRLSAPISRAEISRRVGISKPTVSLALQSLLDAGLVRESVADRLGRPGYGATYFEPVADAALVLGLDVGARFLRGAICDLSGTVRAREDTDIAGWDALRVFDACADLKTRLLAAGSLDGGALEGAVVGVPGVIEREGTVALAENVRGLEGLSIEAELERRLGLPVTADNDVNLAAVGEHWRGVGEGVDDFVFLSVGTGLGAGLVLRGDLHRGRHGAAGEVDFAVAGDGADPSGVALSAYAASLADAGDHPDTTIGPPFDVRAMFGAARAGDTLGRAVVAEGARRIAMHIAPIAAVADVELVVLGGGVGANGDLLVAPVRRELARLLPYPPRLALTSLGDAAVLTGALAVGLRSALDSVFERRRAA